MTVARGGHTARRLPKGQVLMAGGADGQAAAGTWTLSMEDTASLDMGTLLDGSLALCVAP